MKHGATTINITNQQEAHLLNFDALHEATERAASEIISAETPRQIDLVFVDQPAMAQLNMAHLKHEGPTDILTFDYSTPESFHGELIICPSVAKFHSAEFGNSLGEELARYVIHGLLHLTGHDDHDPAAQSLMKTEEDRLVDYLRSEMNLDSLSDG